jgi:hypothetical protein
MKQDPFPRTPTPIPRFFEIFSFARDFESGLHVFLKFIFGTCVPQRRLESMGGSVAKFGEEQFKIHKTTIYLKRDPRNRTLGQPRRHRFAILALFGL